MIRILIRQVIDCRHRASKSLGIGCIEPIAELPLIRGQAAPDYGVRIYHAPPHDEPVRFQTRVLVPPFLLSFLIDPLALFRKLLFMLRSFGAWPTQCSCPNIQ